MKKAFFNTSVLWVAFFTSLFSTNLWAGGAFSTTPAGEPVIWGDTVTYRLDPGGGSGEEGGGCSLETDKQQALLKGFDVANMVRSAFNTWASVGFTSLNVEEGLLLPEDVDLSNMEQYLVGAGGGSGAYDASACYSGGATDPDCLNTVAFDQSGLITRSMLGACAEYAVLGFASILPLVDTSSVQGTILDPGLEAAQMVVSGACLQPVNPADPECVGSGFGEACPVGGISENELEGVIFHEIGHFLGLDHTLVNDTNYVNCTGLPGAVPADCELEATPTMIGFFVPGADLSTLHRDDEATIQRLYPSENQLDNLCRIQGTVTSIGSVWRCEEVVARSNGDPLMEAAAFVSGAESPRFTQGVSGLSGTDGKTQENCTGDCGAYEILVPPGTYTLETHDFYTPAAGNFGFIIEPCDPPNGDDIAGDNTNAAVVVCPAGGGVINQSLATH